MKFLIFHNIAISGALILSMVYVLYSGDALLGIYYILTAMFLEMIK